MISATHAQNNLVRNPTCRVARAIIMRIIIPIILSAEWRNISPSSNSLNQRVQSSLPITNCSGEQAITE